MVRGPVPAARRGPGFGGFVTIKGTRHKVPDWMSVKEAKHNVMLNVNAEGIKTLFVESSVIEQHYAVNPRLFAETVGGMRVKTEMNPLNCDLDWVQNFENNLETLKTIKKSAPKAFKKFSNISTNKVKKTKKTKNVLKKPSANRR